MVERAYNLGNLWRRLALPTRVATWSLTSLQQRLVKTGGRLIKHARFYRLLLAESHLTQAVSRHATKRSRSCLRRRDKARRRAEQISVTAPGTRGEVSPESMGRTASSAVGSPPDAKPASPRTTGTMRNKID